MSCPGPSSCLALAGSGFAQWDGAQWTTQPAPVPAGAQYSSLFGITCPTVTMCIAVGGYVVSDGSTDTLIEQWNGTTWSIVPSPNPQGATQAILYGVSCPLPTNCMAVGADNLMTGAGDAGSALAESWDGATWTIVPTPDVGGEYTTNALFGVSCHRTNVCTGVGVWSYGGATMTLAEQWDGSEWTVMSTPYGSERAQLDAVSCPSAIRCIAVGSAVVENGGGRVKARVDRWNGTSWTLMHTPAATASRPVSFLYDVDCIQASTCTAVGDYSNKHRQATLALTRTGGAWTVSTTRNPGAAEDSFSGVSCYTATTCTAVGDRTSASKVRGPLAERQTPAS